jgi:hypothetical protein
MKYTFVLGLDLEGGVFDLFNYLISHAAADQILRILLVLSELVRSRIKADKFKTATSSPTTVSWSES